MAACVGTQVVDVEEVKVESKMAYESEWPSLHQAVQARRATVAHAGRPGRYHAALKSHFEWLTGRPHPSSC